MSNKLFAFLLTLMLLPFLGWMIYDSRLSLADLQNEGKLHDVLLGADGSMALVQYLFHFAEPVYSHRLNTRQIEVLSRAAGTGEHYHVYGLTQAEYGNGTRYNCNWSKKWFKEEYEMWVEDLRVDFSYNTVNVYVTSDYPEGSCEYQATLEHENRHVEIHKEVYAQYQKNIQDAIAGAPVFPLSSHPIMAPSVEEGKKRLGEMISSVLDPVYERFKVDLSEKQAEIDTPESYNGLRDRCQHW